MKNKRLFRRTICMLIALIMVVSIVPASILDVISEEEEVTGIDAADMVVGKLYSAVWDYSQYPDVYLYSEEMYAYESTVEKSTLPQELIVKLTQEGDNVVYVTNNDWPAVYDEYRYVETYELIITGEYEADTNPEGYIEGQVGLVMNGEVVTRITLDRGEKEYVFTDLGDQIQGTPSYQWQMQLDDGRWANIADYIYPYAVLSEALIANGSSESGASTLRCIVTDGANKYVSGEMQLYAQPEQMMSFAMARNVAVAPINDMDAGVPAVVSVDANTPAPASIDDAFQIVVKYNYRHMNAVEKDWDGQAAANTFTITLPAGGSYTGEISSPPVAGYLPYVREEFKGYITAQNPEKITYDGVEYYLAQSLSLSAVNSKTEIQVYYIPQQVNFRVYIYEQNLQDDEYSLAKTDIKTGIADSAVGKGLDVAKEGFSPLFYDDTTAVSSDGMTVVQIYYDRNYYLIDFSYGQEDGQDVEDAYGATPYYVRYNSQVMLPAPTRPGHTLNRWNLDLVYSGKDANGNKIEVTAATITSQYDVSDANKIITVQHNVDYSATWTESDSSYTVVYWLENADNDTYDVWYTYNVPAKTGSTTTISGADNIKTYVTQANGFTYAEVNDVDTTYPYLTFKSGDAAKTVSGDGKTTINIYYDRKEYTLKFYYAIEYKATTDTTSKYYVIGGSTYYFGDSNGGIEGMRKYASGSNQSERGQVTALPTLNAKGTARPYTKSSDIDGDYKYHFISFTAKYGADITNLWPCAVFNSATRSSVNTHGYWSGTEAFVSAWNGESRVRYTADSTVNKGNETIKGNYTQLDANILWNDPSETDTTISYACFWENGANIWWSVPELYRYNIYLPLLDGQSTEGLTTRIYEGITYYLSTSYDTCDDSNTSSQTQPGLVGFTANGKQSATITSFDTSLYREAYDMFFYYSRNSYNITFNDMQGNSKTVSVPYGTDLSQDAYKGYIPNYPSAFEDGEARFVGWHSDESYENEFIFDNATMPAKNIQLYAEWNTLSYNYEVYLDPEQTLKLSGDTLEFNSQIPEPDYKTAQAGNPEYASLIFAGWYYKDESNEEKRFDFNTMAIKHNLTIYAKWTSRVPAEYTIRYVIENNGVYTDIADPTVGVSLAGITKSFKAKVNTELYDGYREGYFPDYHTHSMTMSNSEDNTCLFVYTQPNEIDYTITHIFKNDGFYDIFESNTLTYTQNVILSGNDIKQKPARAVINFQDGVNKDTIAQAVKEQTGKTLTSDQKTALWEIVTQMSPDSFEQDIYIATDQHSEVTFNWTDRGSVGIYQVVHYFKSLDGNFVADYSQQFVANVGDIVSGSPIEMYGFEENTGHANRVVSGTVTKGMNGLVLRLYYDRITYNYTVHHYKQNTTVKLLPDTYGNKLFEDTVNIADVATTISGYDLANGSEIVQIVNNGQEVICYYSGRDVYYRYQTTSSGGYFENSVYSSDTVVGTAPDPTTLIIRDGYTLVGWYYTVDNVEQIDVPDTWLSNGNMTVQPNAPEAEWANKTIYIYAKIVPTTFTITNVGLNDSEQGIIYVITSKDSGASVRVAAIGNTPTTIQGMPEGQYTVMLEDNWSWRYDRVSASNQLTPSTVEFRWDLNFDGEESVTFTYSDPNDKYVSTTDKN